MVDTFKVNIGQWRRLSDMPWKEVSKMESRREFVGLATAEGANVRELCRRVKISPTTAYKWMGRRGPNESYADRSRRPQRSPKQTKPEIEQLILEMRDAHPKWNARKIRRLLKDKLGQDLPAASTVGAILRRNGRISSEASQAGTPWKRFEHAQPNDLSQMDFMGHFAIGQGRCYSLTMLDDHSRYCQLLRACANERTDTVRSYLIDAFRLYGLPWRMNFDNGNPWGNSSTDPYTRLTVWLLRLAISVSHSRPFHPQTNGKDERFHKTVRAEAVGTRGFNILEQVQKEFDRWRMIYNHERPHESLGLEVPASRYRPSPRSYPETLPRIEYNEADLVRKVRGNGMFSAWGRNFYLSEAFVGEYVALRPTLDDGVWNVYFCHQRVGQLHRPDAELDLSPISHPESCTPPLLQPDLP